MKQYHFAKRQQIAHEHLQTAVLNLAKKLDLEAPEMTPRTKQPKVARLVRDENLGAFLTQIAEAVDIGQTAVVTQETILAIPGLTKTSRQAIENFFEDLNAGSD